VAVGIVLRFGIVCDASVFPGPGAVGLLLRCPLGGGLFSNLFGCCHFPSSLDGFSPSLFSDDLSQGAVLVKHPGELIIFVADILRIFDLYVSAHAPHIGIGMYDDTSGYGGTCNDYLAVSVPDGLSDLSLTGLYDPVV